MLLWHLLGRCSYVCFGTKKWIRRSDERGCFLGCRRRTIPTALLFESTTVKRQLGVGLHVGCGWSILVANLSFLSAKHFQPWTALWRIWTYHFNPVFFSLIDTSKMIWTQKGAGVFTFRCIHWSPISRPVFGLWICFNRNFRTIGRWLILWSGARTTAKAISFAGQVLGTHSSAGRDGQDCMESETKVPKTHGLHRWEELQVTGPFVWGTA